MLELQDLTLTLSNRFTIGPISLRLERGSHTAIIGESGCGKTTLLKIIYGLYTINEGSVIWNNTKVTGPEDNLIPGMPTMKYLSQSFDLMPYTSVRQNINKFLSRRTPEHSERRTAELLDVVDMSDFKDVKVKTLSGGQMQRVALAQVLAKEPELLLLDEPFSHIDNFRKNDLRRKLLSYLKSKNITCLIATHDQKDMLPYTDTTVVMKDGKVLQTGTTNEVYHNPSLKYVGSLFNEINELPEHWFHTDVDTKRTILLYPHELMLSTRGIPFVVSESYFMGSHYLLIGSCKNYKVIVEHHTSLDRATTSNISLRS